MPKRVPNKRHTSELKKVVVETIGKHRDTVLSCGKDVRCHTFAIAVSLLFCPFAIILLKARFSHFEDVGDVMIPQDKA